VQYGKNEKDPNPNRVFSVPRNEIAPAQGKASTEIQVRQTIFVPLLCLQPDGITKWAEPDSAGQ
jgi:hypothetical protein